MILEYINWNVNPELFPNTKIPIRWYGLFFVAAFYLGYLLMQKIFKKEGVKIEVLDKLTMYMLVSTIVGARLGHCLFYEPDYFLSHPLKILFIWEGGLASHGAAIGIVLALWLFSKKEKDLTFLWVIDRVVIMVALAGFWIRMGNLMNSEIIGKATTVSWAFVFERLERYGVTGPHHPAQLYEALVYLAIFAFLIWYYYKKNGKPIEGYLFSFFLVLIFIARFLIEFLKEDQVAFEDGMILNMGQWLSIPFILIGVGLFVWKKRSIAISEG